MSFRSERAIAALLSLGCFAVSVAVFMPASGFEWAGFDDSAYVVDNENLRLGLTPAGLRWAFMTGHGANWFPLTWLSWMADYELFGLEPGAFHRTNVLLHALGAALLSLALWRLTGSVWRSAFVAGVFALHPLHVETVAWVSERKGVLAGVFWMLALLAYAEYSRRPFHILRYGAVFAAMALGLMAKPVLVTLPFVLLLLDFWPLQRLGQSGGARLFEASRLRSCVVEKLPLFGLSALSSYVTWSVQRAGGAVASVEAFAPVARVKNALVAYWAYVDRTFWPDDLALLYPIREIPWTGAATAAALLVAFSGLAWLERRSRPYLLVGWLWFLGTLVPTIGLVQVGTQSMADRYTYLPLIGIAIAVTWAVAGLLARTRATRLALAAISIGVLGALGWASTIQLGYWHDTPTLLRQTLAVTGDNPSMQRLLAEELIIRGELDEAEDWLERSLALEPRDAHSHVTLGELHLERDRPVLAARSFTRAVQIDPSQSYAHQHLGKLRMERHRYAEACAHFELALRGSEVSIPQLRMDLGVCLVELGRLDLALPQLAFAADYARARGIRVNTLAPYFRLVDAARNRDPGSLRSSDLRTPGLLRAHAEILIGADRPEQAIYQLEAALRMAEQADLPEPVREVLRNRLEEVEVEVAEGMGVGVRSRE